MPDTARPRLVVINDDPTFLELMDELLEELEGYEVLLRKEGDHAYEFVKENGPDLVILDVRIEGQEKGWQILELLPLDPETRPIPVIVCSAAVKDLQTQEPRLRRQGVDVLPKPFELTELLSKVKASLGKGPR